MRSSNAIPQDKPDFPRGEWVGMKEAAKIIFLSKAWIYKNMLSGTLHFRWFLLSSGKRVMDSADLYDWLSVKEVLAGKKPPEIQGGAS
jgi:hypothetical protein